MASREDIGRTIARLGVLAAHDPTSVPYEVRISGDAVSYRDITEIVSSVRGENISAVEEAIGDTSRDEKEGQDVPDLCRCVRSMPSHPVSPNDVLHQANQIETW